MKDGRGDRRFSALEETLGFRLDILLSSRTVVRLSSRSRQSPELALASSAVSLSLSDIAEAASSPHVASQTLGAAAKKRR